MKRKMAGLKRDGKAARRAAAAKRGLLLEDLESRLLLSVGSTNINFAPIVPYATGSNPGSVALADFNGDTTTDMAVVNSSDNNVGILMGNGDGTFKTQVTYPVGKTPTAVVTGDFDGKNGLDLAVINHSSGTVCILLNNGDGTFAPAINYSAGVDPVALVSARLTGGILPDLAIADFDNGNVVLLKNQGAGTFAAPVTVATVSFPRALVAADFSGSGNTDHLDLAVAASGGSFVGLLVNNGGGNFAPITNWGTESGPSALAVADFNGDGKPDLAVACFGHTTVDLLMNAGSDTFAPLVSYITGANPLSLVAADFNGDGRPDVATANSLANTVSILGNDGNGTLAPKLDYVAGNRPIAIAAGYLNGDNQLDLAVVNNGDATVGVMLNSGFNPFPMEIARTYPQDQRYVAQLYTDILNRPVDDHGLANFTNQLQQGASAASVAGQLLSSQEYQQNLVNHYYVQILNRPADSNGLATFTAALAGGATDEQVAATIYGSQEFYANSGSTNEGFINALYETALGRPVDDNGLATFTAELAAGTTRQQVAATVLASAEYQQILVTGWYQQYLNRAPDSSGMAHFSAQLAAGVRDETVITQLVISHEYFVTQVGTAGTLNEAYVESVFQSYAGRPLDPNDPTDAALLTSLTNQLELAPGIATRQAVALQVEATLAARTNLVQTYYQIFLGRGLDAGAAQWIAQLGNGTTNESVIASIVSSDEYFAKNGSTLPGFLTGVYRDLLHVTVDPAALEYVNLLNELNSGTSRQQLVQQLTATTSYRATSLNLMYGQMLQRAVDAGGQANFTTELLQGRTDETVSSEVAASAEYYSHI
jgi:hypothetical protein